MLNNHLKSNNIKLSKNLLKTIYESKVFINWTASHIWEIVKEIDRFKKINNIIWDKKKLTNNYLNDLLGNINISIEDLDDTEKNIENWFKSISWQEKTKIWFSPEK
jgi:hypothetical protein